MSPLTGTLYGVGLGPGDPDLLTRKAERLIRNAAVIAYPAPAGADSFARSIAARFIPPTARELSFDVPMTQDRRPAQDVYTEAAARIAEVLHDGEDVVVLCEGDPLFYGSFMYIRGRLAREFPVEIVPGVTSMTASAASAAVPLAARNEVVTVLPAPLGDAELEEYIQAADTLVLMKVGRHLGRVRALLDRLGLAAQATYVERATLAEERVLPLADAPDPAPYFSMILVAKGADPWL